MLMRGTVRIFGKKTKNGTYLMAKLHRRSWTVNLSECVENLLLRRIRTLFQFAFYRTVPLEGRSKIHFQWRTLRKRKSYCSDYRKTEIDVTMKDILGDIQNLFWRNIFKFKFTVRENPWLIALFHVYWEVFLSYRVNANCKTIVKLCIFSMNRLASNCENG